MLQSTGNEIHAAIAFTAFSLLLLGLPLWTFRRMPEKAIPILLAGLTVQQMAVDLYRTGIYISFPADILGWAESDFVNDIIKFQTGYPLYTPAANNESYPYMPGAQLLTWLIASLFQWQSIPFYRGVQLVYVIATAIIGMLCCVRIQQLIAPGRPVSRVWHVFWLAGIYLFATNPITNAYIHFLENDALVQLICVLGFYLLLEYIRLQSTWLLVPMAILPAAGYVVKQSAAIWLAFYCVFLLLFDRQRSLRRVILFGAISATLVAACTLICYRIWGDSFVFWVFYELSKHPVSPFRIVEHLQDVSVFLTVGAVGGLVVLHERHDRSMVGAVLIWAALFLVELYTSGIAWMLHHIGPGTTIGGIWILTGIWVIWTSRMGVLRMRVAKQWIFAAGALGAVAALFAALGFIRLPLSPLTADHYRYAKEIEREFSDDSSANVLLDNGSWLYTYEHVVMKDRSAPAGELNAVHLADYSAFLGRIHHKRYHKILVRNFDAPTFWYDDAVFQGKTGIRNALSENYRVVRRIRGVSKPWNRYLHRDGGLFEEISVLVPNPSTEMARQRQQDSDLEEQ